MGNRLAPLHQERCAKFMTGLHFCLQRQQDGRIISVVIFGQPLTRQRIIRCHGIGTIVTWGNNIREALHWLVFLATLLPPSAVQQVLCKD